MHYIASYYFLQNNAIFCALFVLLVYPQFFLTGFQERGVGDWDIGLGRILLAAKEKVWSLLTAMLVICH